MHRSKRLVPALGTFIRIELELPQAVFNWVTHPAIEKILELEKKFSFFDPNSEISRLNRAEPLEWIVLNMEVIELLKLATTLKNDSTGAFSAGNSLHFKNTSVQKENSEPVDLGGIAKGYIVDEAWKVIEAGAKAHGVKEVFGSVNAGGDLKLHERESVTIAINTCTGARVFRSLRHGSLATSSVCENERASAHYSAPAKAFRKTVSVIAEETWLADALTKVALFHPHPEACLEKWKASLVYEN